MKNPFLIRPTAALASGIMLLSSACTPTSSDPFERMVEQTGLNTDVVDISTHPGTCGDIVSCSTNSAVKKWCTTPLYEGPSSNPSIKEGLISHSNGPVSNYPEIMLGLIFPGKNIYKGGSTVIFDSNIKSVSRDIVRSIGRPRYAYSGNLSECHSGITFIYASRNFPKPKNIDIDLAQVPEAKCDDYFFSFYIYPAYNSINVSTNYSKGECK